MLVMVWNARGVVVLTGLRDGAAPFGGLEQAEETNHFMQRCVDLSRERPAVAHIVCVAHGADPTHTTRKIAHDHDVIHSGTFQK